MAILERIARFEPIAWFNDLYNRGLLDLEPPYQRRSVWNDAFRSYFIDTLIQNFPCPAVFLYEEISPEGLATYKVVDGKQRLTTLFKFVRDEIPISERSPVTALRGKNFSELKDDVKRRIWRYQLSVEFVPQENETVINEIFDRMNRNVAKLTPQELRHAKYNGIFVSEIEDLTAWTESQLGTEIPRIAPQSKRQMKDVEFVAQLVLFLEQGEISTSQGDLDAAFSLRDEEWAAKQSSIQEYQTVILEIKQILSENSALSDTRLRNQADFYSLFGALAELRREKSAFNAKGCSKKLASFMAAVGDDLERPKNTYATAYYQAARSASNDAGPRRKRIDIIKGIVK